MWWVFLKKYNYNDDSKEAKDYLYIQMMKDLLFQAAHLPLTPQPLAVIIFPQTSSGISFN